MDVITLQKTTTLLPLGLYLGLPAEQYFADPALGSSDLRQLANNPFNYWYSSWMNPNRPPEKDTESLRRGAAMHKLVFEGAEEFDRLFHIGPNQRDMTTADKTASTKASNARAVSLRKTPIRYDDYERITIAAAMITKNPALTTAFTGGASEVSFFWMRGDVRLKARFDYLKCTQRPAGMTAGIGDLKSVANQFENDFESECRSHIARYRYDAQAAHYLDALQLVPEAIREGLVHDLPVRVPFNDPPIAKIANMVDRLATANRFGWQWIFIQMEGPPITWSRSLSPENPMVDVGRAVIDKGIARYRECMAEFGPNKMWIMQEPVTEIDIEGMPGWFAR